MAQYLGQLPSTSKWGSAAQAFLDALDKQKQQKIAMAQSLIQSGTYQPTAPGQAPKQGLLGNIGSAFLGPSMGGQNMNVGGQNFQYSPNNALLGKIDLALNQKKLQDALMSPEQKAQNTSREMQAFGALQPGQSASVDSSGAASLSYTPQNPLDTEVKKMDILSKQAGIEKTQQDISQMSQSQGLDLQSKQLAIQKAKLELNQMNLSPDQKASALLKVYKGLSQAQTQGQTAQGGPSQFINKPTVRFDAKGEPSISVTQEPNPDYKSYQAQQQGKAQVSSIMKSSSGDADYDFAKDLAYGRITIPFFESQLRGFSGNTMAIRNAYYAKAKQINPSFNEALFENGMFGPKAGIQSLGRYNAMQGMLAKNVDNQLNVAIGLSSKISRTNTPILNKPDYLWNTDLNQVPGLSGDIKNFINSCKLAAIDAARVETGQTTGAALTDSARDNFKTYLSATDSPETFLKTANFAKLSTRNKIQAGSDEMNKQYDMIKDMQENLEGNDTAQEKPLGAEDIDKMSQPSSKDGTYQDYLKAIGQ